jgi:hypothetical protein
MQKTPYRLVSSGAHDDMCNRSFAVNGCSDLAIRTEIVAGQTRQPRFSAAIGVVMSQVTLGKVAYVEQMPVRRATALRVAPPQPIPRQPAKQTAHVDRIGL